MKCPNCETELTGNVCPNCSYSTVETQSTQEGNEGAQNMSETVEETTQQEAIDKTDEAAENFNGYSLHNQSNDTSMTKKAGKKRLIFEIIGAVLLLCLLIGSVDKVPQSDLDALQKKYDKTSEDLKKVKVNLEEISKTYSAYKEKMKPYETLSESEAQARKIEADKAAADKKAQDDAAAKAAADAAAQEAAKQQALAQASTEQKNALRKAKEYLAYTSFSHSGLIEQLKYEGFSDESATYGADNCGTDWNVQAEKKAKEYMDYSSFSHSGLVEQLVFEGFSQEQAEHGASAAGY